MEADEIEEPAVTGKGVHPKLLEQHLSLQSQEQARSHHRSLRKKELATAWKTQVEV